MAVLCPLPLNLEHGCALHREAMTVSLLEDSRCLRKRCDFDYEMKLVPACKLEGGMGGLECSACGSRSPFSGGSFLLGDLGQDNGSICETWLITGVGQQGGDPHLWLYTGL